MALKEKLESIARSLCAAQGLHLVDVKIRGDRRHPLFEVFADTEQGITLGECERLSRSIQDQLDMDPAFQQNYRLNVSSPGVDYPLTEEWQYRKNIGRTLQVNVRHGEETKEITGILREVNNREIILEKNGKSDRFDLQEIERAKVKLQW